ERALARTVGAEDPHALVTSEDQMDVAQQHTRTGAHPVRVQAQQHGCGGTRVIDVERAPEPALHVEPRSLGTHAIEGVVDETHLPGPRRLGRSAAGRPEGGSRRTVPRAPPALAGAPARPRL